MTDTYSKTEPALDVRHIKKNYGRHPVLQDVTFQAHFGECVGIFGENGCGKSTLLSVLGGALQPSGGSLFFSGQDPLRHPRLFSCLTGYVPQENPLIETLSVRDNLSLWYPDRSALRRTLESGPAADFGLTALAAKPVSRLSGGMKKRLSIVCALANNPRILILDEPTASLDLICKADIRDYLGRYLAGGGLVLLTTHEESELSLCTRALILEGGIARELSVPVNGAALLARMREHHV